MKHVKITFWILGFGCGVILTGIIGVLVSLKANYSVQKMLLEEKYKVQQIEADQTSPIENQKMQNNGDLQGEQKEANKKVIASAEPSETAKQDQNSTKINTKVNNQVSNQKSENQKSEQVVGKKGVTIPSRMSASEICTLLEKEGIVDDGKAFLDYIKKQKKQALLRAGYYELSVGGSYLEILNELVS